MSQVRCRLLHPGGGFGMQNFIVPPLVGVGGRPFVFIENGHRVFALPWPHFGAWSQGLTSAWKPVNLPLSLPAVAGKVPKPQLAFFGYLTVGDDTQRSALEKFRWIETVPVLLKEAAASFGDYATTILRFVCTYGRDAEDLLLTGGHTLVYGLCQKLDRGKLEPGQIPVLLSQKRREIARVIGFPPTKSCIKLLASVTPQILIMEQRGPAGVVTGYEMLSGIANNPDARQLLAHLPRIVSDQVRILAFPPLLRRVTPVLLHELIAEEVPFDIAHELADLVRLEALLELPADRPVFHSLRALRDEHNRLAGIHRHVLKGTDLKSLLAPFPDPPIPGTADIVPLMNPYELISEGEQCHNCVASYINSVKSGINYIYRVLKPGRATLCLESRVGQWGLSELSAPCNENPSYAIKSAVKKWLEAAGPVFDPNYGRYSRAAARWMTEAAPIVGRPLRRRTPEDALARPYRITRQETDEAIRTYCELGRQIGAHRNRC